MKRVMVMLSIVALTTGACGPEANVVDPQAHSGPGALHNEFLSELHAAIDARGGPDAVSPRDENDVIFTVTNQILEQYDEPPMSWSEIQAALDQGVAIAAAEDPWKMVQPLMPAADYKWLQRYINDAEVHEAREVYEAHCNQYGAPAPGSALWTCLDVTISSAEYWYQRSLQSPLGKGDVGPQRAWWKRLITAVVVCASDGVAATVGAAGGGLVGGVVLGYLASYAVDDIIEGETY